MRTLPPLLLIALLIGCGSEPAPVATPTADPSVAESRLEAAKISPIPVESLVGEWRVAGIDGEEVNEPYGITLSIDDETIDLLACAGFKWTYTISQDRIDADRVQADPQGILCRPTPEVQAAAEAIDAARRVERTPSNGIELSGGEHSVLLFSQ